jgi:hypothetical protein
MSARRLAEPHAIDAMLSERSLFWGPRTHLEPEAAAKCGLRLISHQTESNLLRVEVVASGVAADNAVVLDLQIHGGWRSTDRCGLR